MGPIQIENADHFEAALRHTETRDIECRWIVNIVLYIEAILGWDLWWNFSVEFGSIDQIDAHNLQLYDKTHSWKSQVDEKNV